MITDSAADTRDHLFTSCRHNDVGGVSDHLYDWLRIALDAERVFRGVHDIGVDKWRDKIDRALMRSAVCVAVIGPRWADAQRLPRLHRDDDVVRHERVSALNIAIALVPTLVEDAALPNRHMLPAVLQLLLDWNAPAVTDSGWEDDVRRLIDHTADAAGLTIQPDLDTLLRNVVAARQRVTDMGQARQLGAGETDALRRTADDLTHRLAAEDALKRDHAAQARAFDGAHHVSQSLAIAEALAAGDPSNAEWQCDLMVSHVKLGEASRDVGHDGMR